MAASNEEIKWVFLERRGQRESSYGEKIRRKSSHQKEEKLRNYFEYLTKGILFFFLRKIK